MGKYITIESVAAWLVILLPLSMMVAPAGVEVPCAVVGLLFLYRSFREKDWAWTRTTWVRLLGIFWVYMMVRGLFAEHPDDALSRAASFVRYPVFVAALAFWVLRDATTQRRLLYVLTGATLFYIADALFQHYMGFDLFGYDKVPYGSGELLRLTGPFGETRVGIITTWLVFPALLYVASLPQKRYKWFGASLFLAAYLLAVFVSGERMALLLGLMGVVLALLFVKVARIPVLAAGVIAVLTIGCLLQVYPNLRDRQIGQSSSEITHYSDSAYGQLVISALNITKQNPLFGVGNKHFRSACPDAKYGPTDKDALWLRCSLHPHNIYAELLAETGLIGFGLFMAVVVIWFCRFLAHYRLTLADPVLAGITIGVIIKLWPLAATSSFVIGWSAVPMWLFIGWMLARQDLLKH